MAVFQALSAIAAVTLRHAGYLDRDLRTTTNCYHDFMFPRQPCLRIGFFLFTTG